MRNSDGLPARLQTLKLDAALQSAAAAKHAPQACRSMLGELQQESIRRQLTCGRHEQRNRIYQQDEI